MSSTGKGKGKGKGKEVAGKDSFSGKRKRDKDDDKTGRKTRNRAVLQFFDDEAGDAGGDASSDDSIFENEFFDDLFGSDPETKSEPEKAQFVPFVPKEEEMSEEELDKMLAERYKSDSGAVTYAEDICNKQRSAHIDFTFPSGKDPVIWKLKCTVGRERHSVFCLMQKYAELRALGTKLQIISVICLDHVKGYIFVEAEKQVDVNEACKGLSYIFLSRTTKVAANEMSQLLSTRNKQNIVSVGTWARVKSGTYKGDLAQVVAVSDARKRATVKLIPRIDLQVLALKFGGGGASKKTTIPPPRILGLSELEEFRPLIQVRRDRDTDLVFQVLDGLMLKDGYLYKKVPLDSLNFSGVSPSEDEISKFDSSEKPESNDLEWLTQLYGGLEKKRPIKSSKGSDKGGGKGEGSSSSLPSGYEIHDLVCFGRKDFGIVLGFEKDNCKILKDSPEGPVVVTVDPQQLTTALSESKFTALDQKKKTLSLGDTVKVVDGPSQGRQGIVKHVYRGIIFLNDENEENDGYFCAKSFMCEKVKLLDDTFQPGGEGESGFADFPSSPKSHMPRERNRDVGREDKDGMFSIGQTLRIRVGPLKGYLCRVLAIRYSDITVKLNSQTKIFTVKSEHLSEVRKISTISASDDLDSKPPEIFGNLGSTGDWMNGTGTSESNGWVAGGSTTERSGWPSFPSAEAATSDQRKENDSSSWDNPPKNDAGGWGSGTATMQNSAWGGLVQKKPEDGEASGSTWGHTAAPLEDAAGREKTTSTNQSSTWGGWGQNKLENNESGDTETLGSPWKKDAQPSTDSQKDGTAGWENKTPGSQNSTLEGWGKKAVEGGSLDGINALGSTWGKSANASIDSGSGWESKKPTGHSSEWGGWGQKKQEDNSKAVTAASGPWGKAAEAPRSSLEGPDEANNWNKPKAFAGESLWNNVTEQHDSASAWGKKKDVIENPSSGWGAEKNTGEDVPHWGGGRSTEQADGWKKPKVSGGDEGFMSTDDSKNIGNAGKTSGEASCWASKDNWGGGSSNTDAADQGGWGKNTSDGDQGGWSKKTSDGDQGDWGKKTSDEDQVGWGKKTSDGDQGAWGKKNTDGDQGAWSTKTSDGDQGGWGKNTSDGDQGAWGKKTSDEDQVGWGKKTSDGDQGEWSKKNTDGDQGAWGKKNTDGDHGTWSKKTSDGDQGGWGKKTSDGDWSKKSNWAIVNAADVNHTSESESGHGGMGWSERGGFGGRSSFDRGGHRGGGGGGRGCYSCGESGHMSRDCPSGGGGGGRGGGGCYSCGESGHMSRDCPSGSGGGRSRGRGGGGCYSCGESGHMSRDCPSGSGGGRSRGRGGGGCYSCGESGHMPRDCPSGSGGGRGGGGSCYSCGESGHMSRDCPSGGGSGGRGRGRGGSCYSCGESGHMSRDCPSGGSGGRGVGRGSGGGSCYKCGESGHFARDCSGGGS